jgi:hypothetical protein
MNHITYSGIDRTSGMMIKLQPNENHKIPWIKIIKNNRRSVLENQKIVEACNPTNRKK